MDIIPSPSFGSAPHELLHMIFLRTFAPDFLLDSTLASGPNSAWCQNIRSTKNVMRVCRAWCAVATEFLYEDVVLRRIGQVTALLRSLQDNPALAKLIHKVSIQCAVMDSFKAVFHIDMVKILLLCTEIKGLSLSEMPQERSFDFMPFTEWGRSLQLEHLDLTLVGNPNFDGSGDNTHTMWEPFQHLHNLKTLAIDISSFLPNAFLRNQIFHFPYLEHITLSVHPFQKEFYLPTAWAMPQLKEVVLLPHFGDYPSYQAVLEQFFRQYGCGLIALDCFLSSESLALLLGFCPNLARLILPYSQFGTRHPSQDLLDAGIKHLSIQYIDCRTFVDPSDHLYHDLLDRISLKANFPRLKMIRNIDNAIVPRLIPLFITPEMSGEEISEFEYPGVVIKFNKYVVTQTNAPLWLDGESDFDSSYQGSSSDMDGSGSSSDEYSDGDKSSDHGSDSRSLDHDEILAIFDGSREDAEALDVDSGDDIIDH